MKNKLTIIMALCAMQVVFTAEVNQERLNQKLSQAAQKGNTEQVRALLAQGANINEQDYLGYTPLMNAAARGHEQVVKLLIKNGADINIISTLLITTALGLGAYHSIINQTPGVVRTLLATIPPAERQEILNAKTGILASRKKLSGVENIRKLITQDDINHFVENHMARIGANRIKQAQYDAAIAAETGTTKEMQGYGWRYVLPLLDYNSPIIRAEVEQNIRRILFAPEQQ